MASAGARAYNGGLGAEPPVGSRGRAPGQGKPPEAEKLFAFIIFAVLLGEMGKVDNVDSTLAYSLYGTFDTNRPSH